MEDLFISSDKNLLDIQMIHNYLCKESYWAKGRTFQEVTASVEHSLSFGGYINGSQVSFARVITDYTTFAYLADVFVIEKYRGKGVSKKMMEYIFNDPSLQNVKRWMLGTKDAHGLYRQFGFQVPQHPDRWMERVKQ